MSTAVTQTTLHWWVSRHVIRIANPDLLVVFGAGLASCGGVINVHFLFRTVVSPRAICFDLAARVTVFQQLNNFNKQSRTTQLKEISVWW